MTAMHMPKEAISVVVDWWGPYDGIDDARTRMPQWDSGVKALYMGLRPGNVCHYIGRTQDIENRLNGAHDKLDKNASIYVGKISSPGKSGPRIKQVPIDLDVAEQVLIFILQPKDNDYRKKNPPSDCGCGVVFSRLFDADDHETPVLPPPKFPVLAVYDLNRGQSLLLKENKLYDLWKWAS